MLAVLTTGMRTGPLRSCVRGINNLQPVDGVRLDLVIVQNASPEIRADVAALQTEPGGVSEVILEPRAGIPHARNCAIRHAIRLDYDYVAFIDDDAVPDRDWLASAMTVLRASPGEAVTGPQHPVFPPDAPRRLSKAAIYKAVDHPGDRPCRWAASNNVIFSVPFVRDHALLLDESFTTGGSDKVFFREFARAGGRIWWAPDAVVREEVTPERLTVRWALRRSWRLGTTGFRIERSGRPLAAALAVSLFKGAVYIGAGLALLPAGLIPRHAGCIDGLCYITHGAGFVLGISPLFRPRQYS
jgi:succinoglycan biosynthesis protein ExoM